MVCYVLFFKEGDRSSAANYRPVSLTSICCNLNEHIIAKAIVNHFELHNILTDAQHGFRQGRSCETQLLSFIDALARGLSAGQQIDIAIMDLSKSFAIVPHECLPHKLHF